MAKTIMVVDDEPDLREVLSLFLERSGYKVLTAANGREAFELVKSNKIDLVVSDVQMADGNGIELLDKIKDNHYEVPIVLFITGYTDISLEDAYDKGVEAVFAKPFNHKYLLSVVEKALTPKDLRWGPRLERIPSDISVELRFPGFELAKQAKLMNVGRGGIFVALDHTFPKINDQASFKIELGDGHLVIEGDGIVKWVRMIEESGCPAGCGIEFIDLTEDSKNKVIELINYLKTKQYIPKS